VRPGQWRDLAPGEQRLVQLLREQVFIHHVDVDSSPRGALAHLSTRLWEEGKSSGRMQDVLNFIGGRHAPAASGEWLDDVDPATGETYARVASSDGTDVDRAVAAAVRAFCRLVHHAGRREIEAAAAAGAADRARRGRARAAESIDSGKPLSVARTVDVPRAVQNFDFFADAATQFSSEAHPTDEVALNYTLRQPLGAVACISPWNLPLYFAHLEDRPGARGRKLRGGEAFGSDADDGTSPGALCEEAGFPQAC